VLPYSNNATNNGATANQATRICHAAAGPATGNGKTNKKALVTANKGGTGRALFMPKAVYHRHRKSLWPWRLYWEEWQYNGSMFDILLMLVARILVGMFLIGLVGSTVVVVVSFIEDMRELFGD
jgi:hypothetical protein